MDVEIQINNSPNANARFLTWSPTPCRIRITNPAGAQGQGQPPIRISAKTTANGGSVVFRLGTTGAFGASVQPKVPVNGKWVSFFAAGQFGHPSVNLNDVQIQAKHGNGNQVIGATPCTVRIRKNANNLTPGERDRFIAAFAQLNNAGLGRFADFRDMHTNVSSPQAHGAPGFLPWHRAYLLDLERELQAIDASVALPYWRFDQGSPNIFKRDYLGESDAMGTVLFSATNPLQFWKTDGVTGINRRPFFNTNNPTGVRTEAQTLALGTTYPNFRTMEGNPHGSAHTSFGGSISSIGTAARDPLFFLLHCNVDRLWAKWQQINNRFNPAVAASFDSGAWPIGHNLPDTMWPWNGITGPPRPPTAPGGTMAPSPLVTAPGLSPRVRDSLDFQGKISAPACMGFDYDDVPFF